MTLKWGVSVRVRSYPIGPERSELCAHSSRSPVFFFPWRRPLRKHSHCGQNSKSHPSKEIFQVAAHGWCRQWEDDLRQPTSRWSCSLETVGTKNYPALRHGLLQTVM